MELKLNKPVETDEALIFYGTKDVAHFLGCSPPVAREVMRRADFPLIMVGKNMKVSKQALKEWSSCKHT